jgi:hypothetical protein
VIFSVETKIDISNPNFFNLKIKANTLIDKYKTLRSEKQALLFITKNLKSESDLAVYFRLSEDCLKVVNNNYDKQFNLDSTLIKLGEKRMINEDMYLLKKKILSCT